MNEFGLTWARTQVEAMVDGSLSPEAAARMRSLMEESPALRSEVECAALLRQDLGKLKRQPVPSGLWRRLWRIPVADTRSQVWRAPVGVLATVAAVAVVMFSVIGNPSGDPDRIAREQAVRDFATVLAYLQKGTMFAQQELNSAVGSGMIKAIQVTNSAVGPELDDAASDVESDDD